MSCIAIGADHRGFDLKQKLISQLPELIHGITLEDLGCFSSERIDYPPIASAAVSKIYDGSCVGAILLCATGTGMAIAANRFKKIYAAVAWHPIIARAAREDDHANILVLPAEQVPFERAVEICVAWWGATPKKGVYQERLNILDTFGEILAR